jgi:hypothetical protein
MTNSQRKTGGLKFMLITDEYLICGTGKGNFTLRSRKCLVPL